jgi:hypothetical protein
MSSTSPSGLPRARALGIEFPGTSGTHNAITDVPGVEVGYVTKIEGKNIRTGVTAILPRGKEGVGSACAAAFYSLNGNGEMTGTIWIEESGSLSMPILITNTHAVGQVHSGVIEWVVDADVTSTSYTGEALNTLAMAGSKYISGVRYHTSGTAALSNSLAAVIGQQYTISLTITGRTAGSISVTFGGATTAGITASTNLDVLATGVGNLVITPLTAFDGTVVVSIKKTPTLVTTLASSQSSTTVANLVTRLNTTYPVLGVFSTTGGTNLTLVMTDAQKQAICSGQKALSFTVSI